MSQRLRTFLAVELDLMVRKRALDLIKQLQATPAKVRWVAAENLHFTLQFLGEVAVEQTVRVCQALETALAPLVPFEIEVGGAGAFPSARAPRIVWLGLTRGQDAMRQLHTAIGQALEPFGFREENRQYRPHLTLGRVRGAQETDALGEAIAAQARFEAGSMFVDEVTLFSSDLHSNGPEYTVLAHVGLGG
ncbi:MAG TPA: RNA 2',3'-cyclic phosphodiesterase [Pirellulales bacterium]|jgi:2'-5' RNA ligase|nr:RNA 2',3'-cyclic phosphodiesterase [Pirellulales bacterium]